MDSTSDRHDACGSVKSKSSPDTATVAFSVLKEAVLDDPEHERGFPKSQLNVSNVYRNAKCSRWWKSSADIYFIRRIRRLIRGVPEETRTTTRHGIVFGLLVAAVDEESFWKVLGWFEKKHALDCLSHPSGTLTRNLTLIVRWRLKQR